MTTETAGRANIVDFVETSNFVQHYWLHLLGLATVCLQLVAGGHALLNKRDPRSAIGWVGLIWLTPLVGATLYFLLGINRIRRRARSLRGPMARGQRRSKSPTSTVDRLFKATSGHGAHLDPLVRLVGEVTGQPLVIGNRVTPLEHGSRAYPEMLAAIRDAQKSIVLATYIFNNDITGREFAAALGQAVERGVEVRVLVDAIGARYSLPTIFSLLPKLKVRSARFLPTYVPVFAPYFNLRNHRKILVVDGHVGFTGGMNIRRCGKQGEESDDELNDLHFKLEGPIASHLAQVFADDWEFATGESLDGESWFPMIEPVGEALARGIVDGPDENRGKLRLSILGAISCAESRIRILTPYFLPDQALITALGVARMRGVEVDIILPAQNNLALVQWACTAQLWQVLEHGCRVWYSAPPFDHTKLMIVDDCWTLLGSGNWDQRSLRLNFEFNVECYDAALATQLEQLAAKKLATARQVTLTEVDSRALPVRLRDGIARLFSPYL
ncbi:MAG: PLDc N-terminal domain-containing protein [Planctomycetes bacterium]|nr:PLDc N-terminal domain-containing protein [Planctomycetota bacterium]